MKWIKLFLTPLIFATFLLTECNEVESVASKVQLKGVWTVEEIIKEYRDSTQIVHNPQPGIWIFSDGYYSATWTLSANEREPYQQPFNPTTNEKINAYSSIVINTGTYELTDTTLITYPVVSRVPAFSGGKAIYKLKVESDYILLTIKEEYSKKGEWARWLDDWHYTVKLKKKTE